MRDKYVVAVLAGIAKAVLAYYGAGVYYAIGPDSCIFNMCACLHYGAASNRYIWSDIGARENLYIRLYYRAALYRGKLAKIERGGCL